MNFKLLLTFALVLVAGQVTLASPIENDSLEYSLEEVIEKVKEQIQNIVDKVKHAIESANENLGKVIEKGLESIKNAADKVQKEIETKVKEINEQIQQAQDSARECAEPHRQEVQEIRESVRQEIVKCSNDYRDAVQNAGAGVISAVEGLKSLRGKADGLVQKCVDDNKGELLATIQCVVKGSMELQQEASHALQKLLTEAKAASEVAKAASEQSNQCVNAAAQDGAKKLADVAAEIKKCIDGENVFVLGLDF